jgi:hypothetical protein
VTLGDVAACVQIAEISISVLVVRKEQCAFYGVPTVQARAGVMMRVAAVASGERGGGGGGRDTVTLVRVV